MVSRSTTLFLSLLLYLFFFAFFSQSESESDTPKVSLELYYESLCPYSANFIVNHLPKIFTPEFTPIVDVKLVPWGNAKLRPNATFNCQVPFSPNFISLLTIYLFIYLIAAWTKWVLAEYSWSLCNWHLAWTGNNFFAPFLFSPFHSLSNQSFNWGWECCDN